MKYFCTLCFILLACNSSPEVQKLQEKRKDLTNYFRNELSIDLPGDGLIIILQNQNCSACREDVFKDFVNKFLRENNMNKTFILAKQDTALINLIPQTPKNKIILGNAYTLKEYGLNYAADLCFVFRKDKLEKYFEISNYQLDQLKSL